ncbi:MAG: hypothetical protein U0270_27010 [Labilithrix sp.]
MRRNAVLLGGLAVVGLLVGYRKYGTDCCAGGEPSASAAAALPASTADNPGATLPSADAIDKDFEGCKASCGSRSPAMRAAARPQPGAVLGEVVHCPVSGAVFRVKEDATKREVLGRSIYFCCASCAAYFDTHRSEILTARGIPFGGA